MTSSNAFLTIGAIALSTLLGSPTLAGETIHYVNPEAASRVCKSVYHGRDGSYKLSLAPLGTHLFIEDRELARGVTAHVTIGEPDTGLLYLVSTRLSGAVTSPTAVLDRIESRSQAMAVRFPDTFSGRRLDGPFGPSYESTLINANKSGDAALPFPLTVVYTPPRAANAIEGLALNRHFIAQGYYYEIAVLLRNKSTANKGKDELISQAKQWLDLAMAGFSPGKVGACLPE
jgi:hypothetical protein